MSSQITRSSDSRSKRNFRAGLEYNHVFQRSESHAPQGRIRGVGHDKWPAAICPLSESCRSSRASRMVAVMTVIASDAPSYRQPIQGWSRCCGGTGTGKSRERHRSRGPRKKTEVHNALARIRYGTRA